jgi:hypothetical protein
MMLTRSAAWAHRPPLPSSTSFAPCLHLLGFSGPRSQAEGPVEPLPFSACARRGTLFSVTLLNRTRNSAVSASRPPCSSGRLKVRMLSAHGSCLHSKVTHSRLFISEFNVHCAAITRAGPAAAAVVLHAAAAANSLHGDQVSQTLFRRKRGGSSALERIQPGHKLQL